MMLLSSGAFAAPDSGSTPPPRPGPTLAVEDTLRTRAPEPLPEVLVTAPRQTLDEILRRVAEGEAYRDSLIRDQAYTLFFRMTGRDSEKDALDRSEPYLEVATRMYQKRPGKERVVPLRSWSRYDDPDRSGGGRLEVDIDGASNQDQRGPENREGGDKKDGEPRKSSVRVSFDTGMGEAFVGFAFDPKTRGRYRFRIEDRILIDDQVIYVISFAPKSPLDVLPSGRAWINTNDFVILREEFSYRDRSPAPLFMESLDSCVLERTRIDGRHWVLSRLLARVTLTGPIRLVGRISGTRLPKVADFTMSWSDWIINGDIPDSLFAPAASSRAR